jgi:hypothetical protein
MTYTEGWPKECWLWKGAIHKSGYAYRRIDGRLVRAHRAAYEDAFGPILEGVEIHHTCGNKACVNPGHLQPIDSRVHGYLSVLDSGTVPPSPAGRKRKLKCECGECRLCIRREQQRARRAADPDRYQRNTARSSERRKAKHLTPERQAAKAEAERIV